ncbi:hypothetical protein E3Q24_01431 [Wallemia mellicola]|nr:hypothetical protein E3Q24_01431 [Wallemia mellicola]
MKAIRRAFKSPTFSSSKADSENRNPIHDSTNTLNTSPSTDTKDEKHVQFKPPSTLHTQVETRSISPTQPSLITSSSTSRLPLSPSTSSTTSGTWSGMVQFDLVENLSQRERTRQEVLWEIVASEARYVDDLSSLFEGYIKPLLYPYTQNKDSISIPENFKLLLETLGNFILPNHVSLSKDLKTRHAAQYPLIRSLADIFLIHSHNLQYYSLYVLHLEISLSVIDESINLAKSTGNMNKRSDLYNSWKLGKRLLDLEDAAQRDNEAGLAISLLKPFQRLLKYPLLFRNLLFNSDPSMIEYESTLKMVDQVESIVRSIEDRKIQIEERDKTRDVLARIEGIEKERSLMAPKPGRLLMKETSLQVPNKSKHGSLPPPQKPQVAKKTSVRRLSDLLPSGTTIHLEDKNNFTKKDLWHVEFNDVTLLCQRTGRTTLPIASNDKSTPSVKRSSLSSNRSDSLRQNGRNLYRFIKIAKWNITDQSNEGIVSMNAILRSRSNSTDVGRQQIPGKPFPTSNPDSRSPTLNNVDNSTPDDMKSRASTKMSFSYAKGDEITPRIKLRPRQMPHSQKNSQNEIQNVRMAAAKFGTRLRPSNASQTSINVMNDRPSSRATTTGAPMRQKEVVVARTLTPQPPPTSSKAKLETMNSSTRKVNHRKAQLYNERSPSTSPAHKKHTSTGDIDASPTGSISSTSSMETQTNVRQPLQRKSRAPSQDSGMLLVRVAEQYLRESEPEVQQT